MSDTAPTLERPDPGAMCPKCHGRPEEQRLGRRPCCNPECGGWWVSRCYHCHGYKAPEGPTDAE